MVIKAGETDICPHCKISNRFELVTDKRGYPVEEDYLQNGVAKNYYSFEMCRCNNCGEIIIFFDNKMIYPLGSKRPPCPKEVPQEISEDYKEACLVEQLSKKAAAALARRCLQSMLHSKGFIGEDLNKEIDLVMPQLPSHLSDAIDAIRNIGNFAAHPIKSKDTGAIFEVEDGETEWILDVLEQLFDFFYVQPKITEAKRKALNEKLKLAGKPLLK